MELMEQLESELLAIEAELAEPMTNDYGRADKAAAWMLLSKLYLNAEVYINQAKYTESLTYLNKINGAGYSLENNYSHLFLADNNTSNEIIFPITQDGLSTRSWGGTTFLVHAPVGGSMVPAEFGIDGGWSGLRTTKEFVGKFLDLEKLAPKLKSGVATQNYPVIYVPGGYQEAAGYNSNWSPDVAPTLASVNSDGNCEGYIYFADAAEFKFTAGPNWDVNWGNDGADGTLESGSANLTVSGAGYYKMNVNTNDLTYSIQKTDWGLIGSATPSGWDADTSMSYSTETKTWTVTLNLTAGNIKFRANNGWDLNYGDNDFDGTMEEGGADIPLTEAGNYTLTLNLEVAGYSYTVTKN